MKILSNEKLLSLEQLDFISVIINTKKEDQDMFLMLINQEIIRFIFHISKLIDYFNFSMQLLQFGMIAIMIVNRKYRQVTTYQLALFLIQDHSAEINGSKQILWVWIMPSDQKITTTCYERCYVCSIGILSPSP